MNIMNIETIVEISHTIRAYCMTLFLEFGISSI